MGSSPNVFLVSCDPEDFDRTVRSPVDLREFPEPPTSMNGQDNVRFWGIPDGADNEMYFEKLQPGDLVLFYQDGNYVGAGRVGGTFEDDEEWTTNFWTDDSIRFVFTIDDFTEITIPKAAVNSIFDYGTGYTPPRFMRVADGRVNNTVDAIKLALETY